MAGGKGTRFWPSSTATKPKQFLSLLSQQSMLQETYARFVKRLPASQIYVATINAYVELVKAQLPELPFDQLIIEPIARDTGPCIALTALYFLHKQQDDVLVVIPSDQYIADDEPLWEALVLAQDKASEGHSTIMLGVRPTRPETGYGYIRTKEAAAHGNLRPVVTFIEKPAIEIANQLYQSENTFWNSGIFVWRPSTIAYLMDTHCSAIWSPLMKHYPHIDNMYSELPQLSVDYAIIEKAEQLFVIPIQFDWDDVGTWNAIQRHHKADSAGNLLKGPIQVQQAQDNIIFSNKTAVIIGVDHLIIVSTDEGILVCHRSEEHRLKEMIPEQLRNSVDIQHGDEEVKPAT